MEIFPKPEINNKPSSQGNLKAKNYSKTKVKVQNIKLAEREAEVVDFLTENDIRDSETTRDLLNKLLSKRQLLESDFSLQDITPEEIERLKQTESLSTKQNALDTNIAQAKSAENLVDQWKGEGFSNFESLEKLLMAHQNGEITLLAQKYEDFQAFFSFLRSNQFGAADTERIIEVINQPGIDLSSPETFETVIWKIYEDNQISTSTKEKIRQKFRLIAIVTGDDLKENLLIKRKQIKALERERTTVFKMLTSLTAEVRQLDEQLDALKEAMMIEPDSEKRLQLEKQYDQLEERLTRLKKDKENQEELAKELQEQNIIPSVSIRGANADMKEGEILVTIPGSLTQLSVPSHLSSAAIAKAVNAYLVNESLKPFGLESYFFYQSDFDEGKYPYPESLDQNDLLLFRLGFAHDRQILTNYDLREFQKLLSELMEPEEYRMDLTTKENAEVRLKELEIFDNEGLDSDKLVYNLLNINAIRS